MGVQDFDLGVASGGFDGFTMQDKQITKMAENVRQCAAGHRAYSVASPYLPYFGEIAGTNR